VKDKTKCPNHGRTHNAGCVKCGNAMAFVMREMDRITGVFQAAMMIPGPPISFTPEEYERATKHGERVLTERLKSQARPGQPPLND
jgi:hypothetical protein